MNILTEIIDYIFIVLGIIIALSGILLSSYAIIKLFKIENTLNKENPHPNWWIWFLYSIILINFIADTLKYLSK